MKLRYIILPVLFITLLAASSTTHVIIKNAPSASLTATPTTTYTLTPSVSTIQTPTLAVTATPNAISTSDYYIYWVIISSLSLLVSGLSLSIAIYLALRGVSKDKVKLKLTVHVGVLSCKYPSDKKPRPHFVVFSEVVNIGYVSTSITQLGLFASVKTRRNEIITATTNPCFYDTDGEVFASKPILPGEAFSAWINPKRVEGYQLLIEANYPNMEFELGVYAIATDGSKLLSFFTEADLSACQTVILPDEHEKQPEIPLDYPPTSYQLRNPSPEVLRTLRAIRNKSGKTRDEKKLGQIVIGIPDTRLSSKAEDILIKDLNLSEHTYTVLLQAGIPTVGDILKILKKDDQVIKFSQAFGKKTLDEIRRKMRKKGYLKD